MARVVIGNKIYEDTGKSRYLVGYVTGKPAPSEEEQKENEIDEIKRENAGLKSQIEGLQNAITELTMMMATPQ